MSERVEPERRRRAKESPWELLSRKRRLPRREAKHRGRIETIADMLAAMPCKKSHLMIRANLSYGKLKVSRHLDRERSL